MQSILQDLANATEEDTPSISGVVDLPSQATRLFVHGPTEGSVDLLDPTKEHLDLLAAACDPAVFGRNSENVLDETYRKAGKLDPTDFAINIDLAATGLLNRIRGDLLAEKRPIRAELYKLNLYGPGSFFKSHKDTPRGKSMFGSLVLVLPIPHKGGELVLRANSQQEARCDSSAILSSQEKPVIVYVAFYGDIEHEVLPVTSGNRVTLTYNLFFENNTDDMTLPPTLPLQHPFAIAISDALKKPEFLPNGGLLGYGLKYQYAVERDGYLDCVEENLKGEDANVARVCHALKLNKLTKVIVQTDDYDDRRYISLNWVPEIGDYAYEEGLYQELMSHSGAIELSWEGCRTKSSYYREDENEEDGPRGKEVFWITEPRFDGPNIPYVAYGNEATLNFVYGSFCFLIDVKPFEERKELLA